MNIPQLLVAPLNNCPQTHFSSLLCIQMFPDTIPASSVSLPSFVSSAQSWLPLPSHEWLFCLQPTLFRIQALLHFCLAFVSKHHYLEHMSSCQGMPPLCLCHQVWVWMPTHTNPRPSLKTRVVTGSLPITFSIDGDVAKEFVVFEPFHVWLGVGFPWESGGSSSF